jgi:hypothetical protein
MDAELWPILQAPLVQFRPQLPYSLREFIRLSEPAVEHKQLEINSGFSQAIVDVPAAEEPGLLPPVRGALDRLVPFDS